MSVHAEFETGHGLQVASVQGWRDFTDYADNYGGECVRHLVTYGWENDLSGVEEDLKQLQDIEDCPEDIKSTIQDLLQQIEEHQGEEFIIISDGLTDSPNDEEESEDNDEVDDPTDIVDHKEETTQHDEHGKSEIEKLRSFMEKGREAAIKNVAAAAKKIKDLKPLDLDLQTLTGIIEQEIRGLRPLLEQHLTTSTLSSAVLGLNSTVAQVPLSITPPSFLEPAIPVTETLAAILFPGGTPPQTVLPVINAASKALASVLPAVGENYKQTAQLVREGVFAVTGDLTEHAVADIKEQLNKALVAGLS